MENQKNKLSLEEVIKLADKVGGWKESKDESKYGLIDHMIIIAGDILLGTLESYHGYIKDLKIECVRNDHIVLPTRYYVFCEIDGVDVDVENWKSRGGKVKDLYFMAKSKFEQEQSQKVEKGIKDLRESI